MPYFLGCQPLSSGNLDWGVPVQGRRLPLANLIRFPSELLRYDKGRHSKLESKEPCGPKGRLLFDFEAFQVDRRGSLAFTRALGSDAAPIHDFCMDLVSLNEKSHFMAAVFCQPQGSGQVDESSQSLLLPSSTRRPQHEEGFSCFAAMLLLMLLEMIAP